MDQREMIQATGLSARTYLTCCRMMWVKHRDKLAGEWDSSDEFKEALCRELEKGFPVEGIGEIGVAELERFTGYTLEFVGREKLDRYGTGFARSYKILKKVDSRTEKQKHVPRWMCVWLAEKFGHPCGIDAFEVLGEEYCREHCDQPAADCWHDYLAKVKEGDK